MAKLERLRTNGNIPEQQHDSFLLALLIATLLNFLLFSVQAAWPGISRFLRLLIPPQAREETPARPFVLVDPSFLDEVTEPSRPEAESIRSQLASQPEPAPNLPEDRPFQPEGVEELLSLPPGNPGETLDDQNGPSAPAELINLDQAENAQEQEYETSSSAEPEAVPSEEQPEVSQPPPEPLPPLDQEMKPEPQSEPVSEQAPAPESLSNQTPPIPEVHPEGIHEKEAAIGAAEEAPQKETIADVSSEPPAEEEPVAPNPDALDLAMLTETNEPFPAPRPPVESPAPLRKQPAAMPAPPLSPEEIAPPAQPVSSSAANGPIPPERIASPNRPNRPLPTFRSIEGAAATPGGGSAGGAPPRRNDASGINLLRSGDTLMEVLAHRYGEYMKKMARQLQASLNRQMVLSPFDYARGQVKIRFGVGTDGNLAYLTTIFPRDGNLELERVLSERTVVEAAPFDPFPPEMLKDAELFQNLTVVVNLY
ncbi:MAG: hypothetical protein LBE84_08055 [Planctomycetota bacterium]|jgi:hypothetical protein|nr:hypothetical protein [Planctomycetota bacterium]